MVQVTYFTENDMSEKNMIIAESYYKAMGNKDLEGIAKYLHPDVQFIAPLAKMTEKDAVLEAAKKFFSLFNTLEIRAKFGSADQAMLVYDLNCPAPIGIFRAAALMTLKDDLIVRIELFFDTRPFEKK